MKKVLAAVGCGLVAVCLIFAGCSNPSYDQAMSDYEAALKEMEENDDSGSSGDSLSNMYAYQRDNGEYVQNENGDYLSTRPDYDSLFDYESGYESYGPTPVGQKVTLTYRTPDGVTFDSSKWNAKVNDTIDEETGEETWDDFDPEATNNIRTGDTITLPTRNCMSTTRYCGHGMTGWMIVYSSGSTSGPYAFGETVTINGAGTVQPCYADGTPGIGDWTFDTSWNYSDTHGTGSISTSTYNADAFRYEMTVTTTANYWFRLTYSATVAAGSHTVTYWVTNRNSFDISIKIGPSSGGYEWQAWIDKYYDSKTLTLEPGETQKLTFEYSQTTAGTSYIISVEDTTGSDAGGWVGSNGSMSLGLIADIDVDETTTPATITAKLPSGVSMGDFEIPNNLCVGDSLGETELPSASELKDSNDASSMLHGLEFLGWYAHVENTDGSITNTIIGSSYEITSENITVAPYYQSFDGEGRVFNGWPGSGCRTTVGSETWNSLPNGNFTLNGSGSNTNTYENLASQQYNTVIVEPGSDGGYAILGTNFITHNYTLQTNDKFRTQTPLVDDPDDSSQKIPIKGDNIEIYRFENYGSSDIEFTATLVNSGTNAETNDIYIYLKPGESAEYIFSVQYRNGDDNNGNAMMYFTAKSSFTMDIGVSFSFIQADDIDSAEVNALYSEVKTLGYTTGVGELASLTSNEVESATNFIACLTNSTIGAGLTEPTSTTSLVVSYSIDDAYVSSTKKA